MNICLIGNCSGNIDEGMKKIIFNIYKELSECNNVLVLNPLDVFSFKFWKSLREFGPEVVHYIPGPSIKSFIIIKLISIYCKKNTKFIMSAVLPKLSFFSREAMRLFRPDLMIVQSLCTKQMFAIRGFNTKLLPLSGINSKKFSPASADFKYNLRKKYNINFNDFVLLHVGHIKSGRNIAIFKELKIKYNDISIIIVGSTSTQVDEDLLRELVSIGCIVYTKYFEDIEELYQLSDCYVFPTIDKLNSILLPLSILEAMSCNLPVVSTKFGILQEYFKEGEGLSFVDDDAQIISKVNLQRKRMNGISTREKIEIFSWEAIADNLEQVYYDIISGRIDD